MYLAGGVSFNVLSGFQQSTIDIDAFRNQRDFQFAGAAELGDRRYNGGLVAALGVERKFGFLRIAPEFRYTRWIRRNFKDTVADGRLFGTNQNQVQFLLGFSVAVSP